jgi:DNA ligase-1
VLAALAHAVLLHRTEGGVKSETLANELERASQAVKLAYSQCPSYDQLIPALLQYPVEVRF